MQAQPNEAKSRVPPDQRILLRVDGNEHTARARTPLTCLHNGHGNQRLAYAAPLIMLSHAQPPEQIPANRGVRHSSQSQCGEDPRVNAYRERREGEGSAHGDPACHHRRDGADTVA